MESQQIVRLLKTMTMTVLFLTPLYRSSKNNQDTGVYYDMTLADEEQLCSEYSKDCHCGSIAHSRNISLYTRIVYPNGSIKIEEYDEEVPYGYKYLSVYYRCTDDLDVLVGNNMRKCSEGNWIGQVPRCAINFRNETKLKKVRISDFKYRRLNTSGVNTNSSDRPMSATTLYYDETLALNPNGTFEIPLDSQPAECLRWSLSPNQIWSLTLDKPTRVHYVRIKLFGDKIEDLYLSQEIAFDMILKNISYLDTGMFASNENNSDINNKHQQHTVNGHQRSYHDNVLFSPVMFDISCRETMPKTSQYVDSAQQRYSANYLVLDFICEIENTQKSLFEFVFSEEYEIDQLYTSVIDIHFRMLKLNLPITGEKNIYTSSLSSSSSLLSSSGEVLQIFSDKIQNDSPTIQNESSELNSIKIITPHASPASSEIGSETELEFKQKIFVTSLCELKLYSFRVDCGSPDLPVNAIVQREFSFLEDTERRTYKFICSEKNHEVKGNSYVECGSYGRWKNDFPQCARIRPCRLFNRLENSETELVIHYEMQALTKSGKKVIPNDKWARFACIKPNSERKTPHEYRYTQVICRNGKWIGLELSANSACIDFSKLNIQEKKNSETINGNNSVIGMDKDSFSSASHLISLPVRLIRILFALFITLCLIIVCLLVYMILFRRRMLKANSIKNTNYYVQDIPTILYDPDQTLSESRIYAQPSDSNLYEAIPEEVLHYHNYQRTTDNYSDIAPWTSQTVNNKGEERENSIYGFDDEDEEENQNAVTKLSLPFRNHRASMTAIKIIETDDKESKKEEEIEEDVVRIAEMNQHSTGKGYNQLSRSSYMFMKANSIYEC